MVDDRLEPANAGERTQSFPAKKGGALEVRVSSGKVTVKGWEKDEVFVRVQSTDEEQLKKVELSQGGGKVLVEFRLDGRHGEDMRFDIQVPSSFNIDLKTGGGELTLEGPGLAEFADSRLLVVSTGEIDRSLAALWKTVKDLELIKSGVRCFKEKKRGRKA